MSKILICFLLLIPIHFARAWTLSSATESNMKGWAGGSLYIQLNPTNCRPDIRDLVADAMKLWSSIPNSYLRIEMGTDSAATPAQAASAAAAEKAVIVCDAGFQVTFPGMDANFVSGLGLNALDNRGQIVKGALILNTQTGELANINAMDAMSAKISIAHELGHVLGLGHSSDHAALMYFSSGARTNFNLSEDDENGMTYLYGRKEIFGSDEFMGGCGLVKIIADGGSSGGYGYGVGLTLLLLLAPLLLALELRRKPKKLRYLPLHP